jgi:four helix bundle protein
MMKTQHYRDVRVWQKGMELARDVYRYTQQFPKQETFGLTSQMRRAAVSVPSNIAEGKGRLTDRAFTVFLGHARGSLFELETQISLASDLGYLGEKEGRALAEQCAELGRMLNGLLNTVRKEGC